MTEDQQAAWAAGVTEQLLLNTAQHTELRRDVASTLAKVEVIEVATVESVEAFRDSQGFFRIAKWIIGLASGFAVGFSAVWAVLNHPLK